MNKSNVTSLAAQLYTLREFCKTPADIAVTYKKVKAMGYDAVQVSGHGPIDPKDLRKIADDNGLEICATHLPFARFVNDIAGVIAEHQILRCKHPCVAAMPKEMRDSGQSVGQFAKDMETAGRKLTEAGMALSYHNHSFEFEKFDGRAMMDIIFGTTDPRYVMAELDTYWVQHGGADPAAWIERMKGRIPLLHVKDMAILKHEQVMAEIGEGNLNWPAILKAAKAAGVRWYIVEQDVCRRDPFESLAISLKNLKAMGLK